LYEIQLAKTIHEMFICFDSDEDGMLDITELRHAFAGMVRPFDSLVLLANQEFEHLCLKSAAKSPPTEEQQSSDWIG
jgi:Ca2+-binding EF-hand superfamily protein